MFKKYQHIHFVGIGGSGMSGIAEILLTLGYRVSGSDLKGGEVTRRLKRRGAKVYLGHDAQHMKGAHAVVVSSAINGNNPEVASAVAQGVPVVPRAEMLAELMRLKWGIAVSGTHGKTSTTAMIGHLLHTAGLDPTVINGGRVKSLRANARLGRGDFLVAEADESDRSFLKLTPSLAVMTNVDPEHMEQYENFETLQKAFVDFANRLPFYGAVIACADHPIVRRLIPRFQRRVMTYGTHDADYMLSGIDASGGSVTFNVVAHKKEKGRVTLHMCGEHYALNALAAIAVAEEVGISFPIIRRGLATFRGVARRFEMVHDRDPLVVDDYAHHPVEIAATLAAARRGWPSKRLVVVCQPHRYSRLKYHFDDFVNVLGRADGIIIMNVYSAGEKPMRSYQGEKLWKRIASTHPEKMTAFAPTTQEVLTTLAGWRQTNDLILFLGAGSVTETAKCFVKTLRS